jgi:hypothetical protein
MIVLDEHLEEPWLQEQLRAWYRGAVVYLTDLRPGTSIKDDAVPTLLRTVRASTFITINVTDFWRKIEPDENFGVVCLELKDRRKREIPSLLRGLFALEPFSSRKARLGKVVLVAPTAVYYYMRRRQSVAKIDW